LCTCRAALHRRDPLSSTKPKSEAAPYRLGLDRRRNGRAETLAGRMRWIDEGDCSSPVRIMFGDAPDGKGGPRMFGAMPRSARTPA
jgi:hypothetical protein